jgi:hypothetical protein
MILKIISFRWRIELQTNHLICRYLERTLVLIQLICPACFSITVSGHGKSVADSSPSVLR